jgi:hypothetical protein
MTLCIAAIADYGRAICILSDRRLSLGFTSGEFYAKAAKVNQRWGVMLAGNSVASAVPVIVDAKAILWDVTNPARKLVEQAFISVVHDHLVKRIEASILSPYNLTLNEFVKTALKDMGPEAFADLRQQVERVDLGGEFLVFGFDERDHPHIFHIKERGVVEDYSRAGFWAIGSGDLAAISALVFHDYKVELGLAEAAYYVCMAKFMAERAELGRDTDVGYMKSDGSVYTIDAAEVRRIWEADGAPRIPANLASRMPPFSPLPSFQPKPTGPPIRKSPKRDRPRRPPSRA